MTIIDELRKKLALLQMENMKLLGDIADAENRLNTIKECATEVYEQIDEVLDKEN